MKTEMKSRLACSVLCLTLSLGTFNTWAGSPRARKECGIVRNINGKKGTLTLAPEKRERLLVVVWRDDTKFLKNGKFETVSALPEGAHACIFYHSPFFGKPFATKVVWSNGR